MQDKPHAKQLLEAALRDLKVLPVIIDADVVADEIFGYHVQQAVEKCLKAWLSKLNGDYPYTYDISRLLALVEKQDYDVSTYEQFVEYTTFAAQARYVGLAGDDEDPIDREYIITQARNLYNRVRKIVNLSEKD